MAQNDKRFCMSPSLSQELHIWLSFMLHLYKNNGVSRHFLLFFKILISRLLEGKRQKMVQINKKVCLSHTISREPYAIWSLFVVHKCKKIISPGFFFILSKFRFFGLLGGKKSKKWPKKKKLRLLHLISQEPYIIWSSFMVHMCKRIISPAFFSFFQNFNIPGC